MLPVAVLRFSPTEGPGHFADWMNAHDVPWRLIALDAGDAVPADPAGYSGIGMMGGPMSVNDALPWIAPVGSLLRAAVANDVPVIGHCLGGQLLAQALGARVVRAQQPEIGWVDVAVDHSEVAADWFGDRSRLPVFQWHYDAFDLPQGATRVLTNAFNPNQAYVLGDRHIGFQCHIEMTRDLVETWLRADPDELPATSTPACQSAADIRRDLDARVAALNRIAGAVYARWTQKLHR